MCLHARVKACVYGVSKYALCVYVCCLPPTALPAAGAAAAVAAAAGHSREMKSAPVQGMRTAAEVEWWRPLVELN